MATFLEICNKVVRITGITGSLITVESPKGIHRNVVEAVRTAWTDIQTLREDWAFMTGENSGFSTVANKITYTPAEVFGSASAAEDLKTYKRKRGIFLDECMLQYVEYEDLPFIVNETAREPRWYTFNPLNNYLIFERPDDAYPLVIRYNREAQILTLNGDIPRIPDTYHNAITYKAVEKLAAFIGNTALYQEYSREANFQIGSLMREYIRERRVMTRRFF